MIVRSFKILSVVVVLTGCCASQALGQAGGPAAAGVEVDAGGVLRTKFLRDPAGFLTRRRIAEAKAALHPDLARPSKLRKVSLNRLEAAIAERAARGENPTDAMKYLAGLTRLRYVFCYPETNDIVIAGPAEGFGHDLSGRVIGVTTGRSILELQDLIVALRAFPPSGRRTMLIGVSIDPTREGLQQMQKFMAGLGRITPRDAGRIAVGLRENLGLQNVTIRGVSPKTHFAQVLVEADYRMKLIGIGLERPPARITSYVSLANPRDVSRNAMQRWFFTPNYECVRVSGDELAMELVGDGVQLVNDDELVRADGVRVGAGRANRASQMFVKSFTDNYPDLAAKSPVYAQLRNLIDMSVAAAFIQRQDYYGRTGWGMEFLGDEAFYRVETLEAPKHVPSAANAIWKGSTLMTPVGGGVNIQPTLALATDRLLPDEGELLKKLSEDVKGEHRAAGDWWWD